MKKLEEGFTTRQLAKRDLAAEIHRDERWARRYKRNDKKLKADREATLLEQRDKLVEALRRIRKLAGSGGPSAAWLTMGTISKEAERVLSEVEKP